MLRAAGVLIFTSLLLTDATAQFQKLKTISHAETVHYAAIDRPGDLYLIFENDMIMRYDASGELRQGGTLPFRADIFDPRDGSRLFAYNRASRKFLFFSPAFSFEQSPQIIDSAFAIDPLLACSSGDHDLIIVDSADWSLKKLSLKTNRLWFESIIGDSTVDLSTVDFMREYQNFVFMLDKNKGIFIFNMLGKLLKSVEANGVNHFNFLGEELYYLKDDTLLFFDLFNTETRSVTLPYKPDFALISDERLYLVKGKTTEVFSLKP